MAESKRTVLVTGCSDGGMGAELAKQFHAAGLHVLATARTVSKMQSLIDLGIKTLALDISSEESIDACVKKVSRLDILINNAGAHFMVPTVDLDISEGKKLFDTNLWGQIAVIQKFMPLILQSEKPMIVNNTSIGAGFAIPYQASYNASKAAFSIFTDTLRMELEPFDVKVVELRTGGVRTGMYGGKKEGRKLSTNSIYAPRREQVEHALSMVWAEGEGLPADQWAKGVVQDLLKPASPSTIWRGESAWVASFGFLFPTALLNSVVFKKMGLDKVGKISRKK